MKIRVELVTAAVTVTDASGQFVPALELGDFEVYDNGRRQALTHFQPIPQPISMVILVNTSEPLGPLLPRLRKIGLLFTELVLGQSGEAAIVTFNNEIKVVQDFSSNGDPILAALEGLQPGGRGSRLADGLTRAVLMLERRPRERRKVVLVISEPQDRGSESTLGEPLRLAQVEDIAIYTIALSPLQAALRAKPEGQPSAFPPGTFPTPGIPGSVQTPASGPGRSADLLAAVVMLVQSLRNTLGENPLKLYAAGTGGAYFPTSSQSGIEEAVNRIGSELHNQYVLAYRPSSNESGFHEISVRVRRPGLVARTRPGYYVGPPEP